MFLDRHTYRPWGFTNRSGYSPQICHSYLYLPALLMLGISEKCTRPEWFFSRSECSIIDDCHFCVDSNVQAICVEPFYSQLQRSVSSQASACAFSKPIHCFYSCLMSNWFAGQTYLSSVLCSNFFYKICPSSGNPSQCIWSREDDSVLKESTAETSSSRS
jgi:hypothetical protein